MKLTNKIGMIVKERLEALPVKSLASYLGLGLQQHGGPRRKRKQQIEASLLFIYYYFDLLILIFILLLLLNYNYF